MKRAVLVLPRKLRYIRIRPLPFYLYLRDPAPPQKGGGAPSPILRVEVENFEIGPEVGALPVIARFVVLEQQRILVKTRSESV